MQKHFSRKGTVCNVPCLEIVDGGTKGELFIGSDLVDLPTYVQNI